jgi:hypothetical protein
MAGKKESNGEEAKETSVVPFDWKEFLGAKNRRHFLGTNHHITVFRVITLLLEDPPQNSAQIVLHPAI